MKRWLIYGLPLLAFLGAATGLVLQYIEIRDQDAIIETASGVISANREALDSQRVVIDEMLSLNAAFVDENGVLQARVTELEDIANARRCQSIDLALFESNVYKGTSYVITPAKMGWGGYWSIRENVVLQKDYGLARGYEFRIDLTPGDYSDFWQEIHTTIRSFASPEEAKAYFDENGPDADDKRPLESSFDFGIPAYAWDAKPGDSASTMGIGFLCGNYEIDIKTKYLSDSEVALPILEQAAAILFGEISQWAP